MITTDIHTLSMIAITATSGYNPEVRTKVLGSMIIFLNLDRSQGLELCAHAGLTNEQGDALVGEVFSG